MSCYFVEANYIDGHKASRGLSATAELLVYNALLKLRIAV